MDGKSSIHDEMIVRMPTKATVVVLVPSGFFANTKFMFQAHVPRSHTIRMQVRILPPFFNMKNWGTLWIAATDRLQIFSRSSSAGPRIWFGYNFFSKIREISVCIIRLWSWHHGTANLSNTKSIAIRIRHSVLATQHETIWKLKIINWQLSILSCRVCVFGGQFYKFVCDIFHYFIIICDTWHPIRATGVNMWATNKSVGGWHRDQNATHR